MGIRQYPRSAISFVPRCVAVPWSSDPNSVQAELRKSRLNFIFAACHILDAFGEIWR